MNPPPLRSLLCALTLLPGALPAALVVDWGGNYVTGNAALQTGGFSGGEPLGLSPASGYSGVSGTFSGAVAITGTRTRETLVQNASPDRIQIKFSDLGTGNGSALFLWQQENFLNGLDTGNVGFSSTDTITMELATFAQFGAGRVVIQQGSTYFVSEPVFNALGSLTVTPTALNWFAYDPTGWSATNAATLSTIGAAATPVSGGVLANVTEVGFLFTSNPAASNAVRITSFEVNLSAVPEPSAAALALAGVIACGVFRRQSGRSAPVQWRGAGRKNPDSRPQNAPGD